MKTPTNEYYIKSMILEDQVVDRLQLTSDVDLPSMWYHIVQQQHPTVRYTTQNFILLHIDS